MKVIFKKREGSLCVFYPADYKELPLIQDPTDYEYLYLKEGLKLQVPDDLESLQSIKAKFIVLPGKEATGQENPEESTDIPPNNPAEPMTGGFIRPRVKKS